MSSLKYVIFYLNFLLAGIFMFEIGLLPEGLVFLWNDKDCLRCSGRGSRLGYSEWSWRQVARSTGSVTATVRPEYTAHTVLVLFMWEVTKLRLSNTGYGSFF